jgi:hypothetical protein
MTTHQKKGRLFEKEIAFDLNARLVPASGSGKYDKGDIESRKFLIDSKLTDASQYILKASTFEIMRRHAIGMRKHPAMVVGFGWKNRLAIIDYDLFKEFDMVGNEADFTISTVLKVDLETHPHKGRLSSTGFEISRIQNSQHHPGWMDLRFYDVRHNSIRVIQIGPTEFYKLLLCLVDNKQWLESTFGASVD